MPNPIPNQGSLDIIPTSDADNAALMKEVSNHIIQCEMIQESVGTRVVDGQNVPDYSAIDFDTLSTIRDTNIELLDKLAKAKNVVLTANLNFFKSQDDLVRELKKYNERLDNIYLPLKYQYKRLGS